MESSEGKDKEAKEWRRGVKREERNGNKTHMLPAKVSSICSTRTWGLCITYFYNMPLYICRNKKIKFDNLNWKNLFLDILMWLLVLNECLEHASFKRMKYRTDTRGTVPGFACFFQLRVDQWLIHTSIISQLYFCLASSHLLQVTCRWSRSHRTSCTSFPCQPSPSYGILPVCCTQGTRILLHRSLFWL